MDDVRVSGVCPVIETPFRDDETVDVESLARLVDHLVSVGVAWLMYPGFASEFYKLADAERDTAIGVVVERAHRRGARVVISVAAHATALAAARARRAVELGADMVNILPPHAHGPSPAAIRHHVRTVLGALGATPAILQYAPAETGTALDASTIASMARDSPNLVQVKVESAPPGRLISALHEAAPQLSCLVGYAGVQLPDALRRGAVGVQPGCSFAEVYIAIWREWEAGHADASVDVHRRLLPYVSYWMQSIELIIAAEKEISFRRGLIASSVCRAPARQLDPQEHDDVGRFLDEFAELLSGRG